MGWLTDPAGWVAFLTLTALEIVLGIDNVIFISILAGKLPQEKQARARMVGLALAAITRILLLFSLSLLMRLTPNLFTLFDHGISWRDIILIVGGLFLLAKSTLEIHENMSGDHEEKIVRKAAASFTAIIMQIMVLDIVFSLDSVITAVGMVQDLSIMIVAILVAVVVMIIFVGAISRFIAERPTIKVLALSFLLLVGVALVAEGFELHIPRGYIYFAMAFSTMVELINMKIRQRGQPAT